jgi:hypothetical protein
MVRYCAGSMHGLIDTLDKDEFVCYAVADSSYSYSGRDEMALCTHSTKDGSGGTHHCERQNGHYGAHVDHWVDRDGVKQLGLRWTHVDYYGNAVWPWVKNANSVVKAGS